MSNSRIDKASKSFFWLTIHVIIVSLCPFLVRTVMINVLGEEYVGLNSLFVSVLSVLSISELGINDALVYYLYKPMAENDENKINQILNLYKTSYRIIGCIVFFISLILIPFLPVLIKDEIPRDVNVYYLYCIYILNILISYFYKNYCASIFQTNQALYIRYKYESLICLFVYFVQIIFVFKLKTYYGYVIMVPIMTFLTNSVMWILTKKRFPNYIPKGMPEKTFFPEFWKKVVSMGIMKIRGVFRFSMDSMVISSYLGLAALGRYNNYYMIFTSMLFLMSLFSKTMLQSFGNSVAVESVKSNRAVIKLYSFLLQGITIVVSSCLLSLYNDFIVCWIGSKYIFPINTVVLFTIMFYLMQIATIPGLIRNGTGIWDKGLWISVVETMINVVLDLVLVRYYAQDGVIIGTIISLALVNIPFETAVVFKYYFKENPLKELFDYLLNGIIAIAIIYICYVISYNLFDKVSVITFVIKGVICAVLSTILFMVIHIFDSRLKDVMGIILKAIKK